ncbi:hypothetical protein RBJ04_07945 [Klebsiella michiganensis]|uniref:hypothetical protein n=1 Tax=Klebsiella michiganensis TaxID=1134687 RepID=UPI0027C374CB|nr:hypothetical protein [Klebsiella michiganensis]MDQ2563476.1 hypothetical protein [Klebsiella michiganensis]
MTSKLTITDERLAELVAFKPLPGTDINSATRDEWMAMAAELQERRKADSEPVAFINGAWTLVYYRPPKESGLKIGEKLYRHAQQPVVPDIDELRLAFEAAERESGDGFNLHKYGIGYADDETQGRWDTWLACRAAMLNGGK